MSYRYVGPAEIRALVRPGAGGRAIGSPADLGAWVAEAREPYTFVVDLDGRLRLAPRRSEHVACAGGGPVPAAGEMAFRRESGPWTAHEISNQSTGYCPDLTSWHAVARALESAGVGHPDRFTHEVVFRRCERCRECSVVREGEFVCVFCGSDLPVEWNVES
ncbi:hypothetical protein ABZ835_35365 [Streptomyces sp. NPDC047461]|uniref:hypothetical protein n=1 Tax=Streptomyces sp. NPDC047461 TaxID=3155619 RepID=UPI0033D1C268